MNAKEDISKKVANLENPEEQAVKGKIKGEEKKFLGRLKRKYRIMIIFFFFLLLIIAFMVTPMVIAILFQNSI
jgi:accessory gene regulator protein AgrB